MPRKTSHTIRICSLLALTTLSGLSLAGKPVPDEYLASKPLILEVRYCECQATNPDSSPSDLLPEFLDESKILKVGVTGEDKGFVSSREFSIGYEVSPVEDSTGPFRFTYLGKYETSDDSSAGQGTLILEEGRWVGLFGSHHQSESGSQHIGVAVQLVATEGS